MQRFLSKYLFQIPSNVKEVFDSHQCDHPSEPISSAFVCMFIRRENFADQIYIESQYVHFWNDLGLFVGFLSALGMSIVANFQVLILLQHPHIDRFLFYFSMLLHGGVLQYY